MKTMRLSIQRIEFECRIFISLGIVLTVCLISFLGFPNLPQNFILVARMFGLPKGFAIATGYCIVAVLMVIATFIRMWAGSILSSERVMSFKVRNEVFISTGPYKFSRNPIYLADLIAFFGFALCLSPVGFAMPVLLYLHYNQLITYEEKNLEEQFGDTFREYRKTTPGFLPNLRSLLRLTSELKSLSINRDGFRHNALYLLFIPGFVLAAFTGNLFHAMILGLPAVIDWAFIHTSIGLKPPPATETNEIQIRQTVKLKKSKVFGDILYAQCWEDPEIDRKAFRIGHDDVVFSITSGGCNTLAFLADGPAKVIALDLSPYQNYLLDLKMAAFREFDYEEMLEFFGLLPSDRRLILYTKLRKHLKMESIQYWDEKGEKILSGIIHCGRYERYMRLLKKGLVLLVGKALPEELFACQTEEERQDLYDRKWNNWRYRIFTRLFLSRTLMTILFTGRFFDQLGESFSFGDHFRSKIRRAVTTLPLKENHFLAYILLGKYYNLINLPAYLKKENFGRIKSRLDRIEIVTGICGEYFDGMPADSISKFNFSNIFEWMSPPDVEQLLRKTIRVAKDGAILTYRNLLVKRSRPGSLADFINPLEQLAAKLYAEDRSFIYRSYVVEQITKK